jgi:hypothetical protein
MSCSIRLFNLKNLTLCILLLLIATIFLPTLLFAPLVVRGPYLQTATPTSIIIKWRTDVATDSAVAFTVPGGVPETLTDTTTTTEHAVTLTSLIPDTRYNYTIGTSTLKLAGGESFTDDSADNGYFFTTSPLAGTDKPTRIWVIGDSGTADANAMAVRDAYKSFAGNRDTDVWLMLGDNAYHRGTDEQYQAALFDTYPQLLRQVPVWSALGNHDAMDMIRNAPGAYIEIFSFPTAGEAGGVASGTENYYSFDYGDIHFITLDSTISSNNTAGSLMYEWLAKDLAANTRNWTIAFWHHPPYSKGSHDSDTEPELISMRVNALPLLEQGGVDLVLAGHSHSYERSMLLTGHYGLSAALTPAMVLNSGDGHEDGDGAYLKPGTTGIPHAGAVHAVLGSSGRFTPGGTMNHPVMHTSALSLGSLVLDISGYKLNATFIDAAGTVQDEFTIVRPLPATE